MSSTVKDELLKDVYQEVLEKHNKIGVYNGFLTIPGAIVLWLSVITVFPPAHALHASERLVSQLIAEPFAMKDGLRSTLIAINYLLWIWLTPWLSVKTWTFVVKNILRDDITKAAVTPEPYHIPLLKVSIKEFQRSRKGIGLIKPVLVSHDGKTAWAYEPTAVSYIQFIVLVVIVMFFLAKHATLLSTTTSVLAR